MNGEVRFSRDLYPNADGLCHLLKDAIKDSFHLYERLLQDIDEVEELTFGTLQSRCQIGRWASTGHCPRHRPVRKEWRTERLRAVSKVTYMCSRPRNTHVEDSDFKFSSHSIGTA